MHVIPNENRSKGGAESRLPTGVPRRVEFCVHHSAVCVSEARLRQAFNPRKRQFRLYVLRIFRLTHNAATPSFGA